MDLRAIISLACICLGGACQHDAPAPASPALEPAPNSPANKPSAGSAPNPATSSQCAGDSDCRLFDDNCEACHCRALAAGEPDPACHVTHVECFVAPCRGKRAVCRTGQCSVFDQANGEM